MKIMLLLIPIVIALAGCGSDTDVIKSGTLDGYESTTIGKAFDNYSYKLTNKWDEFETNNGQRIVSVNMNLLFPPFCDEACNSIEGLQTFLNYGFGAYAYSEWREKVAQDGKSAKCKTPDAYSGNIDFQFTINRDDSFEVNYVGLEYFIQDKASKDCKYLTTTQLLIENSKGENMFYSIIDAIYNDTQVY